nr:MAG TPA: Protein of unknown function (DUF2977) [Herelleviridae sp.]
MNYIPINNKVDGKVALFLEGNQITGYTTVGGYDADDLNTVVVQDSILPDGFFESKDMGKFLYYDNPSEVVVDPNYKEETEEETSNTEEAFVPSDTEKIKEELVEIKAMLSQLLEQKG